MINKTTYSEIRRVDMKTEGPAILGQTIVNRLLKAKVEENGRVTIKKFPTLGKVIDLVKTNNLKNVRSLFKKHRQEIVDYLEEIGVMEYLGIDKAQQEKLCNFAWTSKNYHEENFNL